MRVTKKKRLEQQVDALMPAFTRALVTHAIYQAAFGPLNEAFVRELLQAMNAAGTATSAPEVFNQAAALASEMVKAGKSVIAKVEPQ